MGPGQLERVSPGQNGGALSKQGKVGQGPESESKLDLAMEGREVSRVGGLGEGGITREKLYPYPLMCSHKTGRLPGIGAVDLNLV